MATPALIPPFSSRPFPAKVWLDHKREMETARAAAPSLPTPAPEARPNRFFKPEHMRHAPDPTPPQPAGSRRYKSPPASGAARDGSATRGASPSDPLSTRGEGRGEVSRPRRGLLHAIAGWLHGGAKSAPAKPPGFGEAFDLALLVSCLPERLHDWLIAQLQPLVVQYAPQRQPGNMAAGLRVNFLLPGTQQQRPDWLRRRLCLELAGGLSLVATPLSHLRRPARNRALVARAEAIGQVAEALSRHPGAAPLEQELARALARLRR